MSKYENIDLLQGNTYFDMVTRFPDLYLPRAVLRKGRDGQISPGSESPKRARPRPKCLFFWLN